MASAVGNTDVYTAYMQALGRAPSDAETNYWKSTNYDPSNIGQAVYNAGAPERASSGYTAPVSAPPAATDMFYNDFGVLKNNPGFTGLKPDAPVKPVAQQPQGWSYTRRDDDVQNSLMGLMDPDSPLMRQANTAGLRTANRRGLLNSSIAAGAVQDAAYTAAVPLASQNASQASAENLANMGYDAQMRMQGNQIGATAALQDQDIKYQQGERALDRTLQEKLAGWNLNSSDRNAASQTLLGMEQLYNSQIQGIMNNTNLSAEDRTAYIASANNLRDKQLGLVEQMYDVSLDWGQPQSQAGMNEADAKTYVSGLYQQILGRPADAAGLNYWVGRLMGGTPKATIEAELKGFS